VERRHSQQKERPEYERRAEVDAGGLPVGENEAEETKSPTPVISASFTGDRAILVNAAPGFFEIPFARLEQPAALLDGGASSRRPMNSRADVVIDFPGES